MQRTHSSNSIIKVFLLAIALTAFSGPQAQTNNDKPVQTPERVGVETADALPLSLNEVIRLALENNNDIAIHITGPGSLPSADTLISESGVNANIQTQ